MTTNNQRLVSAWRIPSAENSMVSPADFQAAGLHQLSPYIGKMHPDLARKLVLSQTRKHQTIFDPFSGSGTIPLEAVINQRSVIASDTNPYAVLLTRAKINPPRNLRECLDKLQIYEDKLLRSSHHVEYRVPSWVRQFFHPRTLAEVLFLSEILREREEFFLLSCLMGILHHQRPGFLSYPSNHSVPFLLKNAYPRRDFRNLYEYRAVIPRLRAKIERALRDLPVISDSLNKICFQTDGLEAPLKEESVDAVITSPPYMDNLDYNRDNRLRLWFLGIEDYRTMGSGQYGPVRFESFITRALNRFYTVLKNNGLCVLVLGDVRRRHGRINCSEIAKSIAVNDLGLFKLKIEIKNSIPLNRRTRPTSFGTKIESILVLQKL